jgi:hypothetical protein
MIEGIEEFYQEIAAALLERIPEDWTAANMEAIFYADGSTYFGEYQRAADGKARDLDLGNAPRTFRALRAKFAEAGQPLRGRARFELQSDGSFKMHWSYDNCDENGDTIFDADQARRESDEWFRRLTAE